MAYIEPVKKGDSLSASKTNTQIREINRINAALDTLNLNHFSSGSFGRVTILNSSNQDVSVGQPLHITGVRWSNVSKSKAVNIFRKQGYQLTGTPTSSGYPIALPTESIPANKIGSAIVRDITAGIIYVDPDNSSATTYDFADLEIVSNLLVFKAVSFGDYKIIGKSNLESNRAFGYLVPFPCSHIIGTTTATVTGANLTDVLITGGNGKKIKASCPLLSGTISPGKKVVVSPNAISREWQIIEAECEEEQE